MGIGLIAARRAAKKGIIARKLTQRTLGDLEAGRYVLQNKAQVMRSARATAGRQLGKLGGFDYYKGDYWEGCNLKQGVMGMAERVSSVLTDEEMRKLQAMDSENLSALYQNNRFVFEVAFDYGGIDKNARGAYTIDESKAEDMRFLISQYERYYGAL